MNREYLMKMDEDELESYAAILDIDLSKAKTHEAKVDLIERRRNRVATVEVMGMTFEVPIKRLHDKRISDLVEKRNPSNKELIQLITAIIGTDGVAQIEAACTDEDGTIDTDAYGLIISRLLNASELKNF